MKTIMQLNFRKRKEQGEKEIVKMKDNTNVENVVKHI